MTAIIIKLKFHESMLKMLALQFFGAWAVCENGNTSELQGCWAAQLCSYLPTSEASPTVKTKPAGPPADGSFLHVSMCVLSARDVTSLRGRTGRSNTWKAYGSWQAMIQNRASFSHSPFRRAAQAPEPAPIVPWAERGQKARADDLFGILVLACPLGNQGKTEDRKLNQQIKLDIMRISHGVQHESPIRPQVPRPCGFRGELLCKVQF